MIVYGDRSRSVSPRAELARVAAALSDAARLSGGDRQERLLATLIDCGELAQGVADAAFEPRQMDEETPAAEAAMGLTLAVARMWLGQAGDAAAGEFEALRHTALPERVSCRSPEGYAFYAVHPGAFAAAAARCIPRDPPPLVIGLRSIGASLAAMVAAALGAPAPITLRPQGPPFRRSIRVGGALRRRLAAHGGGFVVVDEGPGLSGSSFAAAATLLAGLGVALQRIVFMPSHAQGPGCEASPQVRAMWAQVTVAPAAWSPTAAEIAGQFADVTGPPHAVQELSGGAWRRDWPQPERPPAWPAQERRKARLVTGHGAFVARFAGFGRAGEQKLALARRLHAAGFCPEPLALRNGFLLERWIEGRTPVLRGGERAAFLAALARYLAVRARLPAAPGEGASAAALREMALVNAAEAGGAGLGAAVAARLEGLAPLAAALAPVRIDGRLHPWEWRRTPDGGFVKTDALDHAAAHDLVGCQSIAWDLAGAEIEFDLSPAEAAALRRAIAAAACAAPSPVAIAAFAILYCAFQLGWWDFAARQPAPEDDGAAAIARRGFYRERLRRRTGQMLTRVSGASQP